MCNKPVFIRRIILVLFGMFAFFASCTPETLQPDAELWMLDLPIQTDPKIVLDGQGNALISAQFKQFSFGLGNLIIHRIYSVSLKSGRLDTIYTTFDSCMALYHQWIKINNRFFLIKNTLGEPNSSFRYRSNLEIFEVNTSGATQQVVVQQSNEAGWLISDITPSGNGFMVNSQGCFISQAQGQGEEIMPYNRRSLFSSAAQLIDEKIDTPSALFTGYQACVSRSVVSNRPFDIGLISGFSDTSLSLIGRYPSWKILPLDRAAAKRNRIVTPPEGILQFESQIVDSKVGFIRGFPNVETQVAAFVRNLSSFQSALDLIWFTPDLQVNQVVPVPGIKQLVNAKSYKNNLILLTENVAGGTTLISINQEGKINWQSNLRLNHTDKVNGSAVGASINDFAMDESSGNGWF